MDTQLQNLKFTQAQRICSSTDFDRIFSRRSSAHLPLMGLYVDANNLRHPRLGIRISKRYGNAVKRVRARRCFREAFRLRQHELPILDYIVVLRSTQPTTREFETMLVELASRANRKFSRTTKEARRQGHEPERGQNQHRGQD